MVAECEVDALTGDVVLKEGYNGVQNEELVLPSLVPIIVSREISSHIHQIKLLLERGDR